MSNSGLVQVTNISPNKTKRNYRNASSTGKISKITIHHTAGVITAESCLSWFARSSTQASSNYVIGHDGKIGLSVPEDYRSWCSSNGDNDNIAVTIECSNSATGGNWPVSDKVLERCIELCVDICKRNGMPGLKYDGTKNGTLTRHDMFTQKVCPGPYLGSKFPYIAAEVNKRLGNPNYRPLLQKGSSGEYVKELQNDLLKLKYDLGKYGADGSFGDATVAAVKKFQNDYKLTADGIVGDATWAALLKAVEGGGGEYIIEVVEPIVLFTSVPPQMVGKGKYTIVEEKDGDGKLKSGVGWVDLSDVKKV